MLNFTVHPSLSVGYVHTKLMAERFLLLSLISSSILHEHQLQPAWLLITIIHTEKRSDRNVYLMQMTHNTHKHSSIHEKLNAVLLDSVHCKIHAACYECCKTRSCTARLLFLWGLGAILDYFQRGLKIFGLKIDHLGCLQHWFDLLITCIVYIKRSLDLFLL